MQQKRVISSNGIICFEHHKVSFDISCVILQTHAQQYIACTALLSQAKTSCSILLHFHFTLYSCAHASFLPDRPPLTSLPERKTCRCCPCAPSCPCPVIASAVATATCHTSNRAQQCAIRLSLQLPSQLLLAELMLLGQSLPRQAYPLRSPRRF